MYIHDDQTRLRPPGRLPLAPYLDWLPLEINNGYRTAKPVVSIGSATSHPISTSGGDVPSSERSIKHQPTVTGAPLNSAVLAMGQPKKTLAASSLDQSPMLRATNNAFKQFVNNEKLRLRAAREQKRSSLRHEKVIKLEDLKKFGKHFKLESQVPDDLVPILANDPQKQLAIRLKNEEFARVNEQTLNDKKQGRTPTPAVHDHLYQQHQFLQAPQDLLRSQLATQQQQQKYQPNYAGVFYHDPITARPQFGNPLERTVENGLPQTNSSQATLQLPQQKQMPPGLLGAYRGEPTRQYINANSPGLNGSGPSVNGHQAERGDYWLYGPRNPLHQHDNSIGYSSSQRLPSAPPNGSIPPTQVASNSAGKRSHSLEFPQAEQSQKSVSPLAHEAAMLQQKDNEPSQAHHTGRVVPASWAEMVRGKQP